MSTYQNRIIGSLIAATALSTLATSAVAYEKGDWILRAGWAQVAPNESTGNLYVDNTVDYRLPGEDLVDVSDADALGLSVTYMFNSYVGLELLASSPFEHDLTTSGDLAALGIHDLGSTSQLPPTLSVQIYPMGQDSAWQPYVGFGVNYTWFYDEELSAEFKDATGTSNKDFTLSDSVGPAVMVGLDWLFAENWLLNASVMWASIETEAEISNVNGLGDLKVDVDVDPWVYRVNVGYRF